MGRFSTLWDASRAFVGMPAGGKKAEPPKGESGSDADDWYTEMITDLQGGGPDVNPELTGSLKFDVYDEMRKTDPTIKSILLFQELPVRAASWGLNPREEDPLAKAIRDAVNWNFGVEDEDDGFLDLSWDELLAQGLNERVFGSMLEEIVWSKELVEWRDADGDPHLVRPIERVAPRYPRSIRTIKRERGKIVRIEQWNSGTSPIQGEHKISHLIAEREGARWDGVSMLRPAWGAWRLKKGLMIASGIGWDRFATGHPVVWHPDTPEGEQKGKEIGEAVRTHEKAYTRFALAAGETKDTSQWGLEIMNAAQTLADPVPLLRWFSGQEAEAGLAHFSQLGNTETGSRAVAEVQIDPFFLAIQALANYHRRERRRQLFRAFVTVNFGKEASDRYTPKLTVSRIQAHSLSTIVGAITDLSPLGFQLTTRDVQDDVRELLGFSKLPNDLDARGIDRERLRQILASAGLDEAQLAAIVNQLPEDVGVARNRNGRVPAEGEPLVGGGKTKT